jgi:diguanylate cyclase (GGDEF)-like protein/PAS domain S-box-containing protein
MKCFVCASTERADSGYAHLPEDRDDLRADLDPHIRALPLALVILDFSDALTMREWNPQAELLFGYSRAEIIGHSPFEFIVPVGQQAQVRTVIADVAAGTGAIRATTQTVTKDGRLIWCEWCASALRDHSGKVLRIMAVVQDATVRVIGEERTRLWSSLFVNSAEGIMVCDPRLRILMVNAAFEKITGFCEKEAVGRTPRILHSRRQDRAFYANMWQSLSTHGHWSGEIWNRRKSGEVYPEWLNIVKVCDQSEQVTHYVGTFSDIMQRKAMEARTTHAAEHDALTDLANRALLVRRLQEVVAASRPVGEKIAVLFFDIDGFDNVNDSMGRRAGDLLLQEVARRIRATVRRIDLIARLGGDEFAVLLTGLQQPNDAATVARAVLDAVHEPMTLAGQELIVSASAGICMIPDDGVEPDEIVRNATAAMHRAKREGRDTFQFYRREMNEGAADRLRTETALRLALDRRELLLYYQPQVDLATGAILGAEALVRWDRPGVGLLRPAQFIPIAEERGLMASLGRYVLGEALRQMQEWDAQGLVPITVAVNISGDEFLQPGFVDHIESEVRRHGIDPRRLELELTESIAVADVEHTTDALGRLHRLGVRLSLDDFGTGYSSLSYLSRFPIDRIKIDQSFIRDMNSRPGSIQIVRAIVALAKSFAMKVIAEGVETEEQLAALRIEHCDEIQGYLAGKPVAPSEFSSVLRTWKVDDFAAMRAPTASQQLGQPDRPSSQ